MSAERAAKAAETFSLLRQAAQQAGQKALRGDRRTPQLSDELVQTLFVPLLRSWLDENLPQLVDKLVREEIARISAADTHTQ